MMGSMHVPPPHPCRSSPKNGHWKKLSWSHREKGGWFRWVEEKAPHTPPTVPFFLPSVPSQAACRPGSSALPSALLVKKGDLWLGEQEVGKRGGTERTLFLNYFRPLSPTGSHPVPFEEGPFLHRHIFLPRSQPLLPIQLPVLGLGSSIPNGERDTVGLGPRPWTG